VENGVGVGLLLPTLSETPIAAIFYFQQRQYRAKYLQDSKFSTVYWVISFVCASLTALHHLHNIIVLVRLLSFIVRVTTTERLTQALFFSLLFD
jgi:hypothetical protein